MFNVCPECGQWTPDKKVDYQRSVAACPQCDAEVPLQLQPLFILTGASGAGKSATCMALMGQLNEVVVLESDILWLDYFHDPENGQNILIYGSVCVKYRPVRATSFTLWRGHWRASQPPGQRRTSLL